MRGCYVQLKSSNDVYLDFSTVYKSYGDECVEINYLHLKHSNDLLADVLYNLNLLIMYVWAL